MTIMPVTNFIVLPVSINFKVHQCCIILEHYQSEKKSRQIHSRLRIIFEGYNKFRLYETLFLHSHVKQFTHKWKKKIWDLCLQNKLTHKDIGCIQDVHVHNKIHFFKTKNSTTQIIEHFKQHMETVQASQGEIVIEICNFRSLN